MHHIGEYIMKTTEGVCRVEAIVNPDFVNGDKKYYQLLPLSDKSARLYVPVDRTDNTIRAVMTENEANCLIENIPIINKKWNINEKEREKSYKEAIQSNNPERLVEIIKLIYQRKKTRQEQGKKVTATDSRYFEIAEKLLYSELELVLNLNKDEICGLIKKNCEKNVQ